MSQVVAEHQQRISIGRVQHMGLQELDRRIIEPALSGEPAALPQMLHGALEIGTGRLAVIIDRLQRRHDLIGPGLHDIATQCRGVLTQAGVGDVLARCVAGHAETSRSRLINSPAFSPVRLKKRLRPPAG